MNSSADSQTLVLASCSKAAVAIVTNTLGHSAKFHNIGVRTLPLCSNPIGFGDIRSLVEGAFRMTQALFELDETAIIATSVLHEQVSVQIPGYSWRHEVSVGIAALCHRGGPLCLVQAEDWIPEDKLPVFGPAMDETLKKLQEGIAKPRDELLELAAVLGTALMKTVSFDLAYRVVRMN